MNRNLDDVTYYRRKIAKMEQKLSRLIAFPMTNSEKIIKLEEDIQTIKSFLSKINKNVNFFPV